MKDTDFTVTLDEIREGFLRAMTVGPQPPRSRRARLRNWITDKRHALACWISPYDD